MLFAVLPLHSDVLASFVIDAPCHAEYVCLSMFSSTISDHSHRYFRVIVNMNIHDESKVDICKSTHAQHQAGCDIEVFEHMSNELVA